ncbi:conserved hypothetical protein [Pseudomonas aeruginosa 2192]|nr:conserved hypothetical protein [Pseudomonas aeruginosa 2192]
MTSPFSLQDLDDGLGDGLQVRFVQRGDADTAGADGVDTELGLQALDLVGGQAGIGEHATLATDEAEVALGAVGCQLLDHRQAHVADAVAHLAQFLLPEGPQFRAVEHGGDDAGAVGRWVRIVGADHSLHLGQHAGRFIAAFGYDREGADAFAIEREGFGERAGNEEAQARLGEQAHRGGVFLDAVAEALVGDVEERHVALGLEHVQHLFPVVQLEIDAGRIMAAGVQNHDRAGRQGIQVFQQAGAVHAIAGGVVIAVVLHREAGGFEQCAVVFPARVADGHGGVGQQALEEVGAELERAGAADGLGRDHTAGGQQLGLVTEQQFLYALVVGGDPFDRQVAARRVGLDAGLLGSLHGTQQRNAPLLVVVHAHAQVDLARTGIGVEGFVQAKDGITRCHFDGRKQTHFAAARSVKRGGQRNPLCGGAKGCANGGLL